MRDWFGFRGSIALLGLGLVAGGVAMWSIPAALVVSGAILLFLAVAPLVTWRHS